MDAHREAFFVNFPKIRPPQAHLPLSAQLIGVYSDFIKFHLIFKYYVTESVGIATGMLITALHYAGLVSLTYTPGRMGFLNNILTRPANEKPFMILVVGYPADDAIVPIVNKKPLKDVITYV